MSETASEEEWSEVIEHIKNAMWRLTKHRRCSQESLCQMARWSAQSKWEHLKGVDWESLATLALEELLAEDEPCLERKIETRSRKIKEGRVFKYIPIEQAIIGHPGIPYAD